LKKESDRKREGDSDYKDRSVMGTPLHVALEGIVSGHTGKIKDFVLGPRGIAPLGF